LAKENGIRLKLDNKIWRFSDDKTNTVLSLVKEFPDTADITCSTAEQIKRVLDVIPNARIHYDGEVSESKLSEISALVPKEHLTVWLPIKNAHTGWVKVPFATPELCTLAKKYASLGIWLISEYTDFDRAVNEFGADIIETNGQIKPVMNMGLIADMHCHTNASHDAVSDPLELCEAAIKNGVGIFAITDHFDGVAADKFVPCEIAARSKKNYEIANKEYGDKLNILFGFEYGESFWVPEHLKKVNDSFDFDVKLGSVHAVQHELTRGPFAWLDFSGYTEEQIRSYYRQYLDDMLENLNSVDFDVLTHLDNPKKYLTAKFGFPLRYSDFPSRSTKFSIT
jgi:HisJ family histidinol phosphate phosphatase